MRMFVFGEVDMMPPGSSYDEANRARYLAEDQRNNAVSAARSQFSAQVSKEEQARRSAEGKVSQLKNVLRLIRENHVHSEAVSAEDCDWCRKIDEALRL